jgi:hypothetical protein
MKEKTLISVEEAIEIIKKNQKDIGKPKSRIHDNTAVLWVAQRKILEHPVCSHCVNLTVIKKMVKPRTKVILDCKEKIDMVGLYQNRFIIGSAECDLFQENADITTQSTHQSREDIPPATV